MVDKRLRRRTPVRIKQIRGVADELASWTGHEVSLDGFLEQAHYQETDLILVDRVPLAMKIEVGGENGMSGTMKSLNHKTQETSW